jgi:hypothetical protein
MMFQCWSSRVEAPKTNRWIDYVPTLEKYKIALQALMRIWVHKLPSSTTPTWRFGTPNSYTPLESKGGAINWHYMSKEATRYKLREQEGANHRGGVWRRKRRHHSTKPLATWALGWEDGLHPCHHWLTQQLSFVVDPDFRLLHSTMWSYT